MYTRTLLHSFPLNSLQIENSIYRFLLRFFTFDIYVLYIAGSNEILRFTLSTSNTGYIVFIAPLKCHTYVTLPCLYIYIKLSKNEFLWNDNKKIKWLLLLRLTVYIIISSIKIPKNLYKLKSLI